MRKTLALAAFVAIAFAQENCDPFIDDDCSLKDQLPKRAMGAYWLHGVMSWIQAVWLFALWSPYIHQLRVMGDVAVIIAYSQAILNFVTYIPSAIVWSMTASKSAGTKSFRHYFRTLRAINVLGWIVYVLNIGFFLLLVAFTLVDGLITAADDNEMHNYFIVPTVGFVVDFIWQIMYATTYGYSKTLMKCWGYDFPELGDCVF